MANMNKLQAKMGKKPSYGKGINIADNTHASPVKGINTMSEQYDVKKIGSYSSGSKGYPSQALQK